MPILILALFSDVVRMDKTYFMGILSRIGKQYVFGDCIQERVWFLNYFWLDGCFSRYLLKISHNVKQLSPISYHSQLIINIM